MKYLVDFDGTLCLNGKPNILLFNDMRALQTQGNVVILYTSRTGERLKEAVLFCRKNGLIFNGIIGGKPIADFYIDDKAVKPIWQQI